MHEQFAEIEINGKKVRVDSYRELKDSRHFKMLSSLMRLTLPFQWKK